MSGTGGEGHFLVSLVVISADEHGCSMPWPARCVCRP
jgi:hypothetical protein